MVGAWPESVTALGAQGVWWKVRREDAEYAAKCVTEVPEAAAWFTHIDETHGIEHLTVLIPDE